MAPKKAPVTSSRTRQERIKNRGKAPASTPKPRQTAVGNRGAQAGPMKPGTRTSGTPMVNSSSPAMRQIQAKASELRSQVDKGVRAARQTATSLPNSVRAGQNLVRQGAQNMRQAAAGTMSSAQRTMLQAQGAAAKAAAQAKRGAKGAVKQATKGASALTKAGRFVGRAGAVLTGTELFKQGQSGSELDQLTRAIGGKGSNPNTDIGKRAGDAIKAALTQKSNYGPRFKNPNTGTVASKGAKPKAPMPKGSSAALREKSYASLQKFTVPKPKAAAKPKPVAPKAVTTPARSSAPARTPARPAAKPAAKPKAPTSMASESSLSASDIMKGYGMRVNQTFSAQSPSTPKKRQSLKSQKDDIQRMIENSKKRQGKG